MREINEQQFSRFREVYEKHLTEQVKLRPYEYAYGPERVPDVVFRMMNAIRSQSFNKEGRAMGGTCRELGIKHTYKGIREFLCGSDIANDILKIMRERGFISSSPTNKVKKPKGPRYVGPDYTGTRDDQHAESLHERFTS